MDNGSHDHDHWGRLTHVSNSSLPRPLRAGMRSAALDLKAHRARGHVPAQIWAGLPGATDPAQSVSFDTAPCAPRTTLDRGHHGDIVMSLVLAVRDQVEAPLLWVVRSGGPEPSSHDLSWYAASRAVWAELELQHGFAVITREGWTHLPSGIEQRWKRLRA